MQQVSLTIEGAAPALRAADRPRRRHGVHRLQALTWACALSIASAVLLLKISIPPFGARGIGIALFLLPAIAVLGLVLRALDIDAQRLAIFLVLTGVLSLTSLFGAAAFSISSMAMFTVVHLPFILTAAPHPSLSTSIAPTGGGSPSASIYALFLNLALAIALCGIAQFTLQRFIEVRWLFPIENFVPSAFVVQHFNSQGVVEYGSQIYRSNGVFLPEPSYFSQLMAIAIVLELSLAGRWHRLALYAAALLTASAGTGLMILGICVPILIVKRARWDLLVIGVCTLAVVGVLGDTLHLGHLASRSGEFNETGSSAFARFVGGFYLFDQFLWDDPWRTLFGFGAGSFSELATRSHYAVAEMPLFKILMEFGLTGAVLYFGALAYFLFSSAASRVLALAIAIAFLLNGIYAVFGQALALGLLVWPFPKPAEAHSGGSSP